MSNFGNALSDKAPLINPQFQGTPTAPTATTGTNTTQIATTAFVQTSISEKEDTILDYVDESYAQKATTLSGYGITDAKITDQTITLGNKSIDVGLGNAAIYSGVCHTAAATAQKDVVCTSYTRTGDPEKGDIIFVTFDNTNSARTENLTLKVNNSTAKHIQYQGTSSIVDLPIVGLFIANNTYRFQYNGTSWIVMLNYDTNTNTQQRIYAVSGNVEYPIAGVGNGSTYTSPLVITSSYKNCYAAVPSLAANKATINTSTGKITVPGGIQIGTSETGSTADTAQIYGTATIDNINIEESIIPVNEGCKLGDEGWEWDTIYSNNYVGSAQLTGTPTAPTATAGTNTTQIATTAFVQQAIGGIENGSY